MCCVVPKDRSLCVRSGALYCPVNKAQNAWYKQIMEMWRWSGVSPFFLELSERNVVFLLRMVARKGKEESK